MMLCSSTDSVAVEVRRHAEAAPWTYRLLDQRQRQLAEGQRQGVCAPTLLLSEVAPVITYGRRTPQEDLLLTKRDATKGDTTQGWPTEEGVETYPTDRGGYATYHGTGQWVLFPVGPLKYWIGDSRGIQKMIESLLEIALQVGLLYQPSAHIRSGSELGVWTAHGKFAAVGIHVQQGIVLHGLSVNGFKTPLSFKGLRPCGLDAPVDFLLKSEDEINFELLGQQIVHQCFRLRSGYVGF